MLKKKIPIFFINANIFFLILVSLLLSDKLYGISPDYEDGNWSVINTLHFDIYYPDEISDLAFYTAKSAENSYVYLANYFKHEITAVIPVVIHKPNHKIKSDNFNRIDISFNGSYGLLHKELTHGIVHSFQYNIFYASTPGWEISHDNGFSGIPEFIIEGMAEYLSAGYDEHVDMVIRKFFDYGEYKSLLNIKVLKNKTGDSASVLGQSFFYFLETTFGQEIIGELLLNINDYDNIYDAITISTGKNIDELNVLLNNFYKQKLSRSTEGGLNKTDDILVIRLNALTGSNKIKKILIKNGGLPDHIFLYDNITKKEIKDIILPFVEIKEPEITNDGSFIAFIGLTNSSADVYIYNIRNKSLIRITNDRFEKKSPKISPDNNIVFFISNENDKYDFKSINYKLIKFDLKTNAKTVLAGESTDDSNAELKRIIYPESYFDLNDASLSNYGENNDLNFFFKGGSVVWDKYFTGSFNIEAFDFLKEYKIEFKADFLRYKNNNINYYFDYNYLKYNIDFGAEIFYKESPIQSGSQSSYIDDTGLSLIFYSNNIYSKHFGINGFIELPFINGLSLKLTASSAVYENINYLYNNYQKNIYSKQFSLTVNYDSLVYDKVWPVSGLKGEFACSENFDIGEHEASLNVINVNLLRFFQFNKICIFSVKGSAGKISGRDDEYFKYYVGGFNSVRGHGLFEYSGQNAFLLSTEIKFIILDRFTIRWPAEIKVQDISFVLFADFGSAWDNNYNLLNPHSGEFEDLKSGIGTGLRFLLQDHIVFKLDAVWPYYYKSFGKNEFISGFEIRY